MKQRNYSGYVTICASLRNKLLPHTVCVHRHRLYAQTLYIINPIEKYNVEFRLDMCSVCGCYPII